MMTSLLITQSQLHLFSGKHGDVKYKSILERIKRAMWFSTNVEVLFMTHPHAGLSFGQGSFGQRSCLDGPTLGCSEHCRHIWRRHWQRVSWSTFTFLITVLKPLCSRHDENFISFQIHSPFFSCQLQHLNLSGARVGPVISIQPWLNTPTWPFWPQTDFKKLRGWDHGGTTVVPRQKMVLPRQKMVVPRWTTLHFFNLPILDKMASKWCARPITSILECWTRRHTTGYVGFLLWLCCCPLELDWIALQSHF